jgi:cysteinyl-tRNA synthetase
VDYSEASLKEARTALVRGYTALQQMNEALSPSVPQMSGKLEGANEAYVKKISELKDKFDASLDDDFNTAQALGCVFEVARVINQIATAEKKMSSPVKKLLLEAAAETFKHFSQVLGIFEVNPDVFFQTDRATEIAKRGLDGQKIEALIQERQSARDDKDWQRADEIRKELASQSITLKDSAGQTTWLIE